jgi:exodeoxyribonuclease VII large subunit
MANQHILQISELTKKVRFMLESELNTVWLCGEISNFIAASSGHWYLSLKDQKSQVRCAMFKGNNRRVRLSSNSSNTLPRNGQQVLVRAKVSLYEPRGDFQLIIEQMEDAGEGLLRQAFEQLKNKLNNEGLFSQHLKKDIPEHIQTVGIVTSSTGAAIKDILTVLKRRNPHIEVIIYPTLVQGEYAAQGVTQAINIANQRNECDVLIVGRGGGSLEDLWCFNEEIVVRAIYQSQITVVSAVGHEVDTTLSDYVADLRAATPSAAAEIISQDNNKQIEKISGLSQRLLFSIKYKFNQVQKNSVALQHRLTRVDPAQNLQNHQQKADELSIRLKHVIKREISRFTLPCQQLNSRLLQVSPTNHIQQKFKSVDQYQQRLEKSALRHYQHKKDNFVHLIEQLHLVSPLATIARGYSIARNEQGKVIRNVNDVTTGDKIKLQVKDGYITTEVRDTKK